MSLVDGHLVVSRLPKAADTPLSVATPGTVPHIAPIVSHLLHSPEHL